MAQYYCNQKERNYKHKYQHITSQYLAQTTHYSEKLKRLERPRWPISKHLCINWQKHRQMYLTEYEKMVSFLYTVWLRWLASKSLVSSLPIGLSICRDIWAAYKTVAHQNLFIGLSNGGFQDHQVTCGLILSLEFQHLFIPKPSLFQMDVFKCP